MIYDDTNIIKSTMMLTITLDGGYNRLVDNLFKLQDPS